MSLNPTTVIVRPETLKGDQEVGEFVIWKVLQLAFRPLVIWAFFALFFPQLGVTYVLALAGIVALRQLRGVDNQVLVNAVRRQGDRRASKDKLARYAAALK